MKLTDNSRMPFGKYKGKRMQDVPGSYLDWLLGELEVKEGLLYGNSLRVYNYIIENIDAIQQEAKNEQ